MQNQNIRQNKHSNTTHNGNNNRNHQKNLPLDNTCGGNPVRYTVAPSKPGNNEMALIAQRRERAEVAEIKPAARRKPVMHTVKSNVSHPFPWKIILISIIATGLFMLMIYNNVQINEKTAELATLESEASTLENEYSELTLSVEKRNDLRSIEERAIALGMVKADELSKNYISIKSEDHIDLIDETKEKSKFHLTGILEMISEKFNEFLEFIR